MLQQPQHCLPPPWHQAGAVLWQPKCGKDQLWAKLGLLSAPVQLPTAPLRVEEQEMGVEREKEPAGPPHIQSSPSGQGESASPHQPLLAVAGSPGINGTHPCHIIYHIYTTNYTQNSPRVSALYVHSSKKLHFSSGVVFPTFKAAAGQDVGKEIRINRCSAK